MGEPRFIDLRSDTVTRPSVGMRSAMAAAEVGDDVYGEDPSINELEARTAELLGHEAGLFCPTGSMANLLGVWSLVPRGAEVLCDRQAHIARKGRARARKDARIAVGITDIDRRRLHRPVGNEGRIIAD